MALCGASGPDAPAAVPAPVAATLTVQVLGRVKDPGSYVLQDGARVSDALTIAGAYSNDRLVARLGGTPVPDYDCMPGGAEAHFIVLARSESTKTITYYVDVEAARRLHDLRHDPLLRQNDRIFIPECPMRGFKIVPTFPIPPNWIAQP